MIIGTMQSNATQSADDQRVGQWILHVDLDEFIAAVEILRRPDLRGKPVIVGGRGDPAQPRAVVATASYEARAFGVRSGMPLRTAARRCPDAVFVAPDSAAYEAASRRVMDTLRTFPVVVEVIGWDEAFLDVRTHHPEAFAGDVMRAVLDETDLKCSVGIGDNKHRAKIATGFAKPNGIYRLTAREWRDVMFDRPVTALWGIGPRMRANLADMGIATVADLANSDSEQLTRRFGPTMGAYYRGLALGEGDTNVDPAARVPKSHSRSRTYPVDLTKLGEVRARLAELARDVTRTARDEDRDVIRVGVTVRFAPYTTKSKIMKLTEPTRDDEKIADAALTVLGRFDVDRPVRLLGVRVEFM